MLFLIEMCAFDKLEWWYADSFDMRYYAYTWHVIYVFGGRKLSTNGTKPRLLMLITNANGSVQRNRFSPHDRYR